MWSPIAVFHQTTTNKSILWSQITVKTCLKIIKLQQIKVDFGHKKPSKHVWKPPKNVLGPKKNLLKTWKTFKIFWYIKKPIENPFCFDYGWMTIDSLSKQKHQTNLLAYHIGYFYVRPSTSIRGCVWLLVAFFYFQFSSWTISAILNIKEGQMFEKTCRNFWLKQKMKNLNLWPFRLF
jgi:hypothetical protein